eukprot:366095-Chlamydomonas_euryale.AAC.22
MCQVGGLHGFAASPVCMAAGPVSCDCMRQAAWRYGRLPASAPGSAAEQTTPGTGGSVRAGTSRLRRCQDGSAVRRARFAILEPPQAAPRPEGAFKQDATTPLILTF